MIYEKYDKFEYNYIKLKSNISNSIEILNSLGQEGWELINLELPKETGDIYKGLLKRKIICTKVQ